MCVSIWCICEPLLFVFCCYLATIYSCIYVYLCAKSTTVCDDFLNTIRAAVYVTFFTGVYVSTYTFEYNDTRVNSTHSNIWYIKSVLYNTWLWYRCVYVTYCIKISMYYKNVYFLVCLFFSIVVSFVLVHTYTLIQ